MIYCILTYGKKQYARSIETNDVEMMHRVAKALKKDKWNVLVMVHTTDNVEPYDGYEAQYQQWKNLL